MAEGNSNISLIIQDLVKKFVNEWNKQPLTDGKTMRCENAYDINNGLCVNFAEDIINLLGGENNQQFILSNDMFLCDSYKEAVSLWGKKDLIKTKEGAAWSKKMLTLYSIPLVNDIRSIAYLLQHTWVCINLKHYDAENPNGVHSPWELLIFKKFLTCNKPSAINIKSK